MITKESLKGRGFEIRTCRIRGPKPVLHNGCAGSQEGLLVSRECSFRLRVCPILAQIQLQRVPIPCLEEVCSDSRGRQVLASGESLL
jgi:hypothetical protein